jgi:hypothetical protein
MGIGTGLWWHGGSTQGGAGWPGKGPCAVPSSGVGSVGMVGGMAGSSSNNTVRRLGAGKHRMNTTGCEFNVKEHIGSALAAAWSNIASERGGKAPVMPVTGLFLCLGTKTHCRFLPALFCPCCAHFASCRRNSPEKKKRAPPRVPFAQYN